MPKTPDLIGSADVCERFGINRSTLSRWVRAGRITPAAQIGGAFLFRRADVERLAKKQAA